MGLRMSQVNPDSIDEIVARMEDERILFDDWPEFHYRLFEFACLTAEKEGYRPVLKSSLSRLLRIVCCLVFLFKPHPPLPDRVLAKAVRCVFWIGSEQQPHQTTT